MTNPIADITDPATLLALVQGGVKCEECHGAKYIGGPVGFDCPTCKGTGHTPLPNADLNALAACWCEGWIRDDETYEETVWIEPDSHYEGTDGGRKERVWETATHPPFYTTSPDAAMRLQEKYKIGTMFLEEYEGLKDIWVADHEDVPLPLMHKSLCHAITTAALVAALTEAIEGASDAGD